MRIHAHTRAQKHVWDSVDAGPAHERIPNTCHNKRHPASEHKGKCGHSQTHPHTHTHLKSTFNFPPPTPPDKSHLVSFDYNFENYLVTREKHLHHKARTNSSVIVTVTDLHLLPAASCWLKETQDRRSTYEKSSTHQTTGQTKIGTQ